MLYPNINEDRSERVAYDNEEYPAYIRKGILSAFPNYTAQSHWHDDIELILVLSGRMQYNINGEIITLQENEGLFVNSRQLHYGYSAKRQECLFLCVLLHPRLLCTAQGVEERCVTPLLSNEDIPFYHIRGDKDWEMGVLLAIREMYISSGEALSELKIQRAFLDVWIALCENVMAAPRRPAAGKRDLQVLKDMMTFIHENYSRKITLSDICAVGHMGKTCCCGLFNQYTGRTPVWYLTEVRLRRAVELLETTDRTITEICYETGFASPGYFAQAFKHFYDSTPSECRKELQARHARAKGMRERARYKDLPEAKKLLKRLSAAEDEPEGE